MASASGSDNDYRPSFMDTADGKYHDSSAFFHDEWRVETAMVVETPPPPPAYNPNPNYCSYSNYVPYGTAPPVSFAPPMNTVDQYHGIGAFYQPQFPMVQLDAMTPNPPKAFTSSGWAGISSSYSAPLPKAKAPKAQTRRPKEPKKVISKKKEPRLNPITGHPMPPTSKVRQRRKAQGSAVQEETRKKKKKVIPRDLEAERDALSRKENQCYQKGTVLVRYEEVNLPTYGHTLWVVENYQLIQKYELGNVERDGTRRFYKTERYLGWLADDPAIYFPVNDVSFGADDKVVMIVRKFPSQTEVSDYYEKMKANRPVFPKLDSDSNAEVASPEGSDETESNDDEEDDDYVDEIKQEPQSDDDMKEEPESEEDIKQEPESEYEFEEGEIID